MSKACSYTPKNMPLKTFYALKKAFGYDEAWKIYYMVNSKEFMDKYKDSLTLDSEGFPTFESLRDNEAVRFILSNKSVADDISKNYKPKDYNSALQEAYKFNTEDKNRKDFIAIVDEEDDNKFKVNILPRNKDAIDYFNNQYSGNLLNNKLVNILDKLNLRVDDLSKSYDNAKDIASDIIKIKDNNIDTLSSAFADLIIDNLRTHPLINRLLKQLQDLDTVRKILGDDYEMDDEANINAENAFKKIIEDGFKTTINSPLMIRSINYIKGLFKEVNKDAIAKAITDSEAMNNELAEKILRSTVNTGTNTNKEETRSKEIQDKIDRNKKILKTAIDTEAKKYKIFGMKEAESNVLSLKSHMNDEEVALGICMYANTALNELTARFNAFSKLTNESPKNRFAFLRTTRSIIQSYSKFIKELNDARVDDNGDADNMFLREFELGNQKINMSDLLKDLNDMSQNLVRLYMKTAVPSFAEFLRPMLGDRITVMLGKEAGKQILVKDLLTKADNDISFMDRWLDSMANSSDILLQAFDSIVKQANDRARLTTIDNIKDIQLLQQDAEKLGITDWSWIYEKDKNGNLTGNIISKINYSQYGKDIEALEKSLNEKYGKNPKGEALRNKQLERENWHKTHSINMLFSMIPNPNIYTNQDYVNLDSNHKKILERYLKLKERIDKLLPSDKASNLKAIQIRKDGIQRFLDSTSSPSTIWANVKEHLSDEFLEREDDDNIFGSSQITKGMTDFAGKEFMTLPILYTNRLKNANDLTNDAIGALMAYTAMGNKYSEMDKIIDPLEVGRSIITDGERVTQRKQRSNKMAEKFSTLGVDVLNDIVEPDGSNAQKKLDDFFASQVYGRYMKQEGTFEVFGKKASGTKIANWIMRGSSVAMLGLNTLAWMANAATGVAMQNIESAAGEFFTASQLLKADGLYTKLLPEYMSELNKRNKQSKLGLIDEYFNIKGEYFENLKRNQRKGILSRIFGAMSTITFLGQNCGDHWLYNRTLLAMMQNTKVRVPNKGTMNLYDAIQIREKFAGSGIKELYLPEGITDENGKPFDLKKFSRKVLAVNQKLFGIYNSEDKNAAKRLILGRAILQFRDWIKPQMNMRFEKAQYNMATGAWEEGYYRTFARIAMECIRGQRRLGMLNENLTSTERANLRRAIFELMQFGAVWALSKMLSFGDKDKKRPWALKLIEYMLNRERHELGFLAPQPTFLNETLANIKSPAASMSMLGSFGTMMESLISPEDWEDELQSGPYKGMSTVEKNFLKLPLPVLNQYRQINKVIDDDAFENSIKYYMKPSAY